MPYYIQVEDDDKCTTARADALESNAIPKPHRYISVS